MNESVAGGAVIYEEQPARDASGLVSDVWRFTVEAHDPAEAQHIIPPDGLVSLVGALAGERMVHFALLGPSARAQTVPVRQGVTVIGLRFGPGLVPAIFGLAPADFRDRIAGPDELPANVAQTASRVFACRDGVEAGIAGIAFDHDRIDMAVCAAAEALLPGVDVPAVAELAAGVGLSPRQFHRRFVAAIGLPPKVFAQVRRQRAAWLATVLGAEPSLSGASAAAGFADQAHFTRTVRATFDATPREVGRYLGGIRHVIPAREIE